MQFCEVSTVLGGPVFFVVESIRFGVGSEQIVGANVAPNARLQPVLGRNAARIVATLTGLFRFVEGDPPFDVIAVGLEEQIGVVDERVDDEAL